MWTSIANSFVGIVVFRLSIPFSISISKSLFSDYRSNQIIEKRSRARIRCLPQLSIQLLHTSKRHLHHALNRLLYSVWRVEALSEIFKLQRENFCSKPRKCFWWESIQKFGTKKEKKLKKVRICKSENYRAEIEKLFKLQYLSELVDKHTYAW